MKIKRILYLENGIGYGGAVVCMKLLAENLDKNKYYPVIVTSRNEANYQRLNRVAEWHYIKDKVIDREELTEKVVSFFKKLGMKGKFVSLTISTIDYIINQTPYFIKLLRLVKRKNIDLIHLNNEPVCNMCGVLVANLLEIPCISHVRGPVWDSKTSRWLYSKLNFTITVSEWVRREVLNLNVADEKVKAIPDGREVDRCELQGDVDLLRKSLGLKSGQLSVGMIGLLNPWKGQEVFIKAAQKVLKQFPDCKLLIIGGPAEKHKSFENELKAMVRGMELVQNVIFTGHRSDVVQVIGVLDLVVHASIEPDPYPNVVIETMLMGRPIIASNIGGPLEMIDNYITGVLIPPNDADILANTICELLKDNGLRIAIGKEARRIAFERNSIETHVRNIADVYEKVLANPIKSYQ